MADFHVSSPRLLNSIRCRVAVDTGGIVDRTDSDQLRVTRVWRSRTQVTVARCRRGRFCRCRSYVRKPPKSAAQAPNQILSLGKWCSAVFTATELLRRSSGDVNFTWVLARIPIRPALGAAQKNPFPPVVAHDVRTPPPVSTARFATDSRSASTHHQPDRHSSSTVGATTSRRVIRTFRIKAFDLSPLPSIAQPPPGLVQKRPAWKFRLGAP